MSGSQSEYELENALKSKEKVFALFYSANCPFSQRFLPIFEKFSKDGAHLGVRILVEKNERLVEKYSVEIVPTLLVFEKGEILHRLDAEWGVGISEKRLKGLIKDLALA